MLGSWRVQNKVKEENFEQDNIFFVAPFARIFAEVCIATDIVNPVIELETLC